MLSELLTRTDTIGQRLERIPPLIFGMVVLCLMVIRNGVHIFETDWVGLEATIAALPEALNYNSWSWGNLALGKLFGIDTWQQWVSLHVGLTVLAIIVPLIALARTQRAHFHLLAVYWVLIPAVGSLLLWVGMYDVLTYIGATMIVLSKRWWLTVLGAIVMSSGNPEQAVLAALVLLVATASHLLKRYRTSAYISVGVTTIALVLSRIFIHGPAGIDRSEVLLSPSQGLGRLVLEWPASVWGLNGVLWVVVIIGVILSNAWGKIALTAAFAVIPIAAILVTFDWFRVYWFVSLVGIMALGISLITQIDSPRGRRVLLLAGITCLILVPTQTGSFFFLYDALGSLLLSAP